MYAIVRADLEMPAGKMSAQAGHAFTESLFDCLDKDPGRALAYHRMRGSKVTLKARNLHALQRAHREAIEAGLPCSLFVDEGHVLMPHFDGSPVVTALGIGPCTQAEAHHITKRYSCVTDDRSVTIARILTDATREAVKHLHAMNDPGLQEDGSRQLAAETREVLEVGLATVESLTGKIGAAAR